jgi:general secretion pathway protein N
MSSWRCGWRGAEFGTCGGIALKRWIAFALVAVLSIAATVALLAPAQWAAGALRSASGGRLDLAGASGSLWRGSAILVVSAGAAGSARASLPEPLSWQLSPWALFTGTLDLTLSHPSALAQPLVLRASPGSPAVLGATTLRLPATLLSGLGAPWNTIQPGGLLTVSWDRLLLSRAALQGQIVAEWQFASSALTPVSPFGHYRLTTGGQFPGTTLQLQTLSGPLELTGTGRIDAGPRLSFDGVARPLAGTDASIKTQLTGLISLLGPRRDSESVFLKSGS